MKDFQTGKFKIVDIIFKYPIDPKDPEFIDRQLIYTFRFQRQKNDFRGIGEEIYEEILSEDVTDEIASFVVSDEALDELKTIDKILKERKFYRNDCPERTFCIIALFKKEFCILGGDDSTLYIDFSALYYGELYESIRPLTEVELERIFAIFKENLSPDQYRLIKFFVEKKYELDTGYDYLYSKSEIELIRYAIENIRRSNRIKDAVNDILDNTLF